MHKPQTITVAPPRRAIQETPWYIKWPLVLSALAIISVLVIVPVVNVFYGAIAPGIKDYWESSSGDETVTSFGRVAAAVRAGFYTYWSNLVDDQRYTSRDHADADRCADRRGS